MGRVVAYAADMRQRSHRVLVAGAVGEFPARGLGALRWGKIQVRLPEMGL